MNSPRHNVVASRASFVWHLRTRSLALGRQTRLMGIVNVTPDSFSDGGLYAGTEAAVEHALHLLDAGADIVDIGGESTRPGSLAGTNEAIGAAEEQRRVLPVIRGVLKQRPQALIAIDTYRASTAQAAVDAGAEVVNDVSGLLWDPAMASACARLGCGVVLMHTRGLPSAWAAQPPLAPAEVLPVVTSGLLQRMRAARLADIALEKLLLDPGFGFGKLGAENWQLLAGFSTLQQLDLPLLAGLSRKGFLGNGQTPAPERDAPTRRDPATHAAGVIAALQGAHVLRVHDVRGAREAVAVADAVRSAAEAAQPNARVPAPGHAQGRERTPE